MSEGAIVHPLMLLNVNIHVNSVIESWSALMKFMEVLMNVCLPYSFNCWRKWMHILGKCTAIGVFFQIVGCWRFFSSYRPNSSITIFQIPAVHRTQSQHYRRVLETRGVQWARCMVHSSTTRQWWVGGPVGTMPWCMEVGKNSSL